MIWFNGPLRFTNRHVIGLVYGKKLDPETPIYSMVKIMLSGEDFPEKTSPTNMRSKTRSKIGAFPGQHR